MSSARPRFRDVLRYTPQQPFTRAEHYYANGAQYSQMRGIGVDTTLILINGRRAVPTSNSLTLNAFDLNSIPLAAVERIEVLSDSASAIYGADAMGGVINVVLKKKSRSRCSIFSMAAPVAARICCVRRSAPVTKPSDCGPR